jgi:membrane protein
MTVEMLVPVFKKAFKGWGEDQVPRLSASFTFYLLLALSPMLLFFVAATGLVMHSPSIREGLIAQIKDAMGEAQAGFISSLMTSTQSKGAGILATLFGLVVALFGASGLFEQLRESVNTIWGVKSQPCGVWSMVLRKFVAFLMVILGGLVMAGWLILDARLHYLNKNYMISAPLPIWQTLSFVVSWAFWSVVFAGALKYLPERPLQWRDVWLPAFVTSLAFALGKYLLSLYFSYSSVNVSYGSAGAVVLLLLWVYYSAQIFFFGVELTEAYALAFGSLKGQEEKHETAVRQGGVAKATG